MGNFGKLKCIGATLAKTFFAKSSEINVFRQFCRGESFWATVVKIFLGKFEEKNFGEKKNVLGQSEVKFNDASKGR